LGDSVKIKAIVVTGAAFAMWINRFGPSLLVYTAVCGLVCANPLNAQPGPSNKPPAAEPTAAEHDSWLILSDCVLLVQRTSDIPAEDAGRLVSLDVELNQAVAENAVLARLDSTFAKNELRAAELQLKSAVDLANDESEIKLSNFAMSEAKQELAKNRAISNSVSDSELSKLQLKMQSAEAAVHSAQRRRDRALIDKELREVALDAAKNKLAQTNLVAPNAGVVQKIYKQRGDWVQKGEPVIKVSDMQRLNVDTLVELQRIDLSRIVGSEVRVESKAGNGPVVRLPGKIKSYDHEVSKRGLIRLHAEIENSQVQGHWSLLPGMPVTLHVALKNSRDNLTSRGLKQNR
jgi:multidrug efflux pump subunit AcrA (membrane-fusion protein)